jgi:hypothetical protein
MIDLLVYCSLNDASERSVQECSTALPEAQAESFPLVRYTHVMYPPRVSNSKVRALIREMTVGRTLPSGAAIRTELDKRFASRGSVARIYRLLAEERVRLTPAPLPGSVEALQRELEVVRERLARAEEREYTHQSRWAEEVDQLRLKLAALEPLAQQGRLSQDSDGLLRHRLQAAEHRAAAFEQQLYEITRREGHGSAVLSIASAVEGPASLQVRFRHDDPAS